jgi:hypothetical protein
MVSTSKFDSPGRSTVALVTGTEEVTKSAVSWAAIVAGAVAAAATTLILLLLGTGIGLSVISPWYGAGASAITVGVSAIIWLVVVQWLSSALGGFIAGRLRTKWVGLHTHEVSFRDTAHGFLAWCLASVVGAAVLASITASGVSGLASGAATVAAGAASGSRAGSDPRAPERHRSPTRFRPPSVTRSLFRQQPKYRPCGRNCQGGRLSRSRLADHPANRELLRARHVHDRQPRP